MPKTEDDQFEAVVSLAGAVIRAALVDALDPRAPEAVRAGARAFLRGNGEFRLWCRILGADWEVVRDHAARALARPCRPSRPGDDALTPIWTGVETRPPGHTKGELLEGRPQRRRPMAAGPARCAPINEADEGVPAGL